MKVAGVATLKSRLSEFLAAVKAREEITVTERGRPIARIVPISPADTEEGRLADLEWTGLQKRPARSKLAGFRPSGSPARRNWCAK